MSYVDTTHFLECRYCVSTSHCRDYVMACNILGVTKSGNIKIEVFGDRDWDRPECNSIRHIRYLKPYERGRLVGRKKNED